MHLHTHRTLISVVTIFLAAHGFIGLLLGGAELAANFALKTLLQNPSSNSTFEGTMSGAVSKFLANLDSQVIDQIVRGGLEMYKALIVCCVSCCDLWRMLRIMCGVLGIFMVLSAVNIYLLFDRRTVMEDVVDNLEDNFLANFHTLYRDTRGVKSHARFTFEMNGFQVLFKCCGVHSYLDYANASLWKAGPGLNMTVPPTCCRLDTRSFIFINCIIYLQEPCMAHPTPENSFIGQGCFQGILLLFRIIFLESLVWNCISVLIYIIILVLFVVQIRFWAHKTEDPFEGLRGFLKETQNFVQEMEVGEKMVEEEKRNKSEDVEEESQQVIGTLFDVVLLAASKNSDPKE